jgi:hypothetical protein
MTYFMVFDVESVGLHGEGFAVGWTVIDGDGKEIAGAEYACDPDRAAGDDDDRAWIKEHCRTTENVGTLAALRHLFWEACEYTKKRGGMVAADVPWPVEARFLAACVDADREARKWAGPYPLLDIASVRYAAGLDPLRTEERLPRELPEHSPLADARQSARLLIEALRLLGRTA